ncbi:hypothetical protein F5Y12DRAFT_711528 [Xylaria sp. FL1777]|nr:hypothetical protein F5Y12DRAFT_711528 [Xylaria sp. FL1777]
MSSLPIVNTLIRSPAREASHNGRATTPGVSQPLHRTYATSRPSLPGSSGGNRQLMFAALVGIPALVYFMIPSRPTKPTPAAKRAPNLDPAARKRERDENEPDSRKYVHPEHENPEEFKPEFGQLHKQKRVDTPPDGRHHQALNDRARNY